MDMERFALIVAAVVAVSMVLFRLRRGLYGRMTADRAVTQAYEAFAVDPRLRYYVSGPDACPNAIMGIRRDWMLMNDLWKMRDLDTGRLRSLVEGMQQKAREQNRTLQGFDLEDHRGEKIGTWFSVLGIQVAIRVADTKQVSIDTPPIDPYPLT